LIGDAKNPNPQTSDADSESQSPTGGERKNTASDAVASAVRHVEQIVDHVLLLLRVQRDRAALGFRRTIARIAILSILGIAGIVAIGAATVMVLDGVAGGLRAVLGAPDWLARLVTGAGVLSGFLGITRLVFARRNATILRERREDYGRLQIQHYEKYGKVDVQRDDTAH